MKLLDIYEKSDVFKGAKGGEMSIETVSLFVTGIAMREILFPEISLENSRHGFSFEQVWYALCLYHDNQMENACIWEKVCQGRRNRGIRRGESGKKDEDDKWGPLNLCFSPLFYYSGDGIRFTGGAQVRECFLSEDAVKDYYYFRSTCYRDGGMDHGIAGGLLLYENLVCRHLQRIGETDRDSLNLYSYAANTLLVHNICQESRDGERITPAKDPLLFLLMLAEAIEPLQYAIECTDCRKILDRAEVEIRGHEIRIRIDPNCFFIGRWEEKLRKMEKKILIDYKIWRETAGICIRL